MTPIGHNFTTYHTALTNSMEKTASAVNNALQSLQHQKEQGLFDLYKSNEALSLSRQQVALDALDHAQSFLLQLGAVVSRATDDTLSLSDRAVLQQEADQILAELSSLQNTSFHGQKVLSGGQTTSYIDGPIDITMPDASVFMQPLSTGVDLLSTASATIGLAQVQDASKAVTEQTVIAANGAAMISGKGSLAALQNTLSQKKSSQDFLQALDLLSMSKKEFAIIAKVHSVHNTLKQTLVDRLV